MLLSFIILFIINISKDIQKEKFVSKKRRKQQVMLVGINKNNHKKKVSDF